MSYCFQVSTPVRSPLPPGRLLRKLALRGSLGLFCVVALLSVVSAGATTWYVDNTATGGAKNGTSWASAWTSISSISGVKAGDTVYISGGPTGSSQTYSMSGAWSPAGGSSGNPITYQIGQDSSHNGTAIFSGSGTFIGPANYAVISGNAGDGNMHFAISTGYNAGANVTGTTGYRISYVNFGSSLGDGLDGQNVSQLEYDHNYCMIAGNVDHFCSCGIVDPGFDGTKIHDNTIYVPNEANAANGADAFQLSGSGFSLYNNLISGYNVNWTVGGIQHEDGIQTLVGSYMKIYGNTFQNLANSCIFMDGYYGAFAHIYIYNNIMQITSSAANVSPGCVEIGADGSPAVAPSFTDIIVANNIMVDFSGPNQANAIAFGNCPGCNGGNSSPYTGCYVVNNILLNSGSVLTYSSPVTTGNNVVLSAAQGQTDFTSYKTLTPANNYHLSSTATAMIGKGANEYSYFTTDMAGNIRPASGAWDIGPYIYGSSSSGPVLAVSPISYNASDVDPNTAGLQVYQGTTVQFSSGVSYTGTGTVNWQWSYTVDGGSPVIQSGTGTVPSESFNFATAPHTYVWTLLVTAGTNSASASLTVSSEVPPAPNTSLSFQATSGTITAPFTVTGNYVSQAITTTTISATGEDTFNFTITNAGNYVIQALVNAPNDSANSFYVNIDAQPVDPAMAWDIFPFTSGFQNVFVSWRGSGTDTNDQYIPKIFALSAGTHQIIIAGREAGTQLESFSLIELPATPQNLRVLSTVMGNAPNFSAGP
jgi:hypothetical protein